MPITRDQLRDNPWWADRDAIASDPYLVNLKGEKLVYNHNIPFRFDTDGIYTLRGPRQVGKTTLLKRIVRRLLDNDGRPPRSLMYLDVEGAGLKTSYDLQNALQDFLDWMRSAHPEERAYMLLDEITGIDSWGTAIRVLHGRGSLRNCTVLCTGSHARDVKRGAERAPGRKGEVDAWDWIMMPLSFRDFIAMHDPRLVEQLPTFDPAEPAEAHQAGSEIELHQARIHSLFDRFLLTGGYPHAVSAEAEHGEIPTRVYRLYQEAFRGEIVRAGHREDLFRELVTWLASTRLGSEFNWRDASGDTAIGSHHTVREYMEDAEAAFLWHIIFRVKNPERPAPAPKSPKKLYPVDPFAWHVLSSWVTGSMRPWRDSINMLEDPSQTGMLVESITGDHMRRRRGPFTLYHRAARGAEEIDFVSFEPPNRALIEVKYRNSIKSSDKKWLREYGGGIVVTKRDLFLNRDNNVAGIPAPSFLAGIDGRLTLYPAVE